MNFNDKTEQDQPFVLNTEEDEFYDSDTLLSSDSENRLPIKSKLASDFSSKGPSLRGKENNLHYGNNKNVITNHSFNGFFNQNTFKSKKNINESIHKRSQLNDISNQNYQVKSPTNFNSTGKLSNLQFVGDSSGSYEVQQTMHSEVKSFVKKYFPQNFQSGNFHGKFVSIEHLVEILFEEFQNLIGKQSSLSLMEDFSDKVFLVFGERVYFEELFQRTYENGLTGLIFQIVKSIKDDQRQIQQSKESKSNFLKPIQAIQSKGSFANKVLASSNLNLLKSQKRNQILVASNKNAINIENSTNSTRIPSEKISLQRYFGSSLSKVQFHENDQLTMTSQDDHSQINEQNLQEIKLILQDYIEAMYEQAESKLNKKYSQEMKKITLKYKQTEKLLEKVNERISNHYDSIQLEKEYEKKVKLLTEKEVQLQNLVKKLEFELKTEKDNVEKEKITSFKLDQDMNRLKEKLEKYENAIFEKAMEKGSSNQASVTGSTSILKETKTNSSIHSQIQNASMYPQVVHQQNPPRFEVKIDTVTEYKPVQISNTPIHQSSYTPYVSRHMNTSNLTPTRIKEMQRPGSFVSPIRQRISFIKTQNPTAINTRVMPPNDSRPLSPINGNSRILYSTNSNIGQHNQASQINQNMSSNQMKVSNVEMVEIGEKIQLRPLSPIGKLSDLGSCAGNVQPPIAQNYQHLSQQASQNLYVQRSYSPIKVQFCTSRVSTLPSQNR